MKLYEIANKDGELSFRKMRVESGYLYNFWNYDKQDFHDEWIFVPDATTTLDNA